MSSMFRHFDGMAWPASSIALTELEWGLRYQQRGHIFTMEERLAMASVISAYKELIWQTQGRRNAAIREIRKGPSD